MQNYKVHGLSEIMIFHCDMDKDELFQTAKEYYEILRTLGADF